MRFFYKMCADVIERLYNYKYPKNLYIYNLSETFVFLEMETNKISLREKCFILFLDA